MAEPVVRLLDSVRIDESREFFEFRFRGADGAELPIQIDFAYVESLVLANRATPRWRPLSRSCTRSETPDGGVCRYQGLGCDGRRLISPLHRQRPPSLAGAVRPARM
jgi:hypothetical protein